MNNRPGVHLRCGWVPIDSMEVARFGLCRAEPGDQNAEGMDKVVQTLLNMNDNHYIGSGSE